MKRKTISVSLPLSYIEKLDAIADDRCFSRSTVIALIIRKNFLDGGDLGI